MFSKIKKSIGPDKAFSCQRALKLLQGSIAKYHDICVPWTEVITRESQPVLTALKLLPSLVGGLVFFLRMGREGYLDLKTLFSGQSYEDSAQTSLISLLRISVFSSVLYQADEHHYLYLTNTLSDHPKAWWLVHGKAQNETVMFFFRPVCDLQNKEMAL